jgi:hypothetical protein
MTRSFLAAGEAPPAKPPKFPYKPPATVHQTGSLSRSINGGSLGRTSMIRQMQIDPQKAPFLALLAQLGNKSADEKQIALSREVLRRGVGLLDSFNQMAIPKT